jgi:hypothetical protein
MCWACQQDPLAGFNHATARWNAGARIACARKAERAWEAIGSSTDAAEHAGAPRRDGVEGGRTDERSH